MVRFAEERARSIDERHQQAYTLPTSPQTVAHPASHGQWPGELQGTYVGSPPSAIHPTNPFFQGRAASATSVPARPPDGAGPPGYRLPSAAYPEFRPLPPQYAPQAPSLTYPRGWLDRADLESGGRQHLLASHPVRQGYPPPGAYSTPGVRAPNATYVLNETGYVSRPDRSNPFAYQIPACPEQSVAMAHGKVAKILLQYRVWFSTLPGEDPQEFLERLADCCMSFELSEEEIFRALPLIFRGAAIRWWRVTKQSLSDYGEFLHAFRLRFCPGDRQAGLWEDIRARTQGEQEPIAEYVTSLRGLFELVDPCPPMKTQLDTVYAQMNPRFAQFMQRHAFHSYEELLEQGSLTTTKLRCISNYRPPPAPGTFNNPAFAYTRAPQQKQGPQLSALMYEQAPGREAAAAQTEEGYDTTMCSLLNAPTRVNAGDAEQPRRPANKTVQTRNVGTSPPVTGTQEGKLPYSQRVCYNCLEPGHFAKECPEPRRARNSASGGAGGSAGQERPVQGN